MTDIQPDALREALQFLIRSDMPADPKRMLIEVVMQSLADREASLVQNNAIKKTPSTWHQHEVDLATAYLQGKVANSWQGADEAIIHLARALHRDASDIRIKAVEMGFGVAVDYRSAKEQGVLPSGV